MKQYVREAYTDKWKPTKTSKSVGTFKKRDKILNTMDTNLKEIDKEIYFELNDGRMIYLDDFSS